MSRLLAASCLRYVVLTQDDVIWLEQGLFYHGYSIHSIPIIPMAASSFESATYVVTVAIAACSRVKHTLFPTPYSLFPSSKRTVLDQTAQGYMRLALGVVSIIYLEPPNPTR